VVARRFSASWGYAGGMDEPHFTPSTVIRAATEPRGLTVEQLGVAPVVILAWGMGVIHHLAEAIGAEPSENWMYCNRHPLYVGEVAGRRVSIAHMPVGAPGTVMMMEEMVAAGARAFWGCTAGGSLTRDAPIGSCVIPTSAVSEEGTSRLYVGAETPLIPDPRLVSLVEDRCRAEGVSFVTGPVWTTDAPYRETRAKIESYAHQGVVAVDMETSAMYALGHARRVSVCSLLVVSDELWRPWRFGGPRFQQGRDKAANVILRCVATTEDAIAPSP
jgi:uridine phosphorylase